MHYQKRKLGITEKIEKGKKKDVFIDQICIKASYPTAKFPTVNLQLKKPTSTQYTN